MRAYVIILSFITCLGSLATDSFAADAKRKTIALPEEIIFNKQELLKIVAEKRVARFLLGRSRQSRNVEAWFFPGASDKNALVIGGVHGSELSAVEIAQALIRRLQQGRGTYYNVIVIPSLFPDNMHKAINNPLHIGSGANIGRYTLSHSPDPNRQMPTPGKAFDEKTGLDHLGREIETENQLLLQLIQSFRPQRIINIHAIKDITHAGVFADPRTDHRGVAQGYASDSSLAIAMAKYIHEQGGNVKGNTISKNPNALYYKDPVPVRAGAFQKRNMSGSALNGNRGSGISLGTWASTAIAGEEDPSRNRDALRILTMEYPGSKRPSDYVSLQDHLMHEKQIELFASSIYTIFLGSFFVEE